jgi:phage FluMu protein Com
MREARCSKRICGKLLFKVIGPGIIETKCKCGAKYKIKIDKNFIKVYSIDKLGVERLERQM